MMSGNEDNQLREPHGGQTPDRRASVSRQRAGFTVSASPLNGVKLELGIILFVALVLLPVVERISPRLSVQLLILSCYGVAAMLWLLLRTRRVVQSLEADTRQGHEDRDG